MHKAALGAVVALGALSASGAYAQSMEVTSGEIHNGASLGSGVCDATADD
jgi:hypothetical protein